MLKQMIETNPKRLEFKDFKVGSFYEEALRITNRHDEPVLIIMKVPRPISAFFEVEPIGRMQRQPVAPG